MVDSKSVITDDLTFSQYSHILNNAPRISIYHSPAWIKLLLESFGGEFIALRTRDGHAGSTLAITPFIKSRKLIFKFIGSPLSGTYTEYCGPVVYESLTQEYQFAEVLISQHNFLLQNYRPKYIEWGGALDFQYPGRGLEILSSFGYEMVLRPTLHIDLSMGVDQVWNKFQGRARNVVRKASRENLIIEYTNFSESEVYEYYELLCESFCRQGAKKPSHPIDFFHSLRKLALTKHGQVKFCGARKSGRLVSGAIFLETNKRVVYLSGASNEVGLHTGAASLIQWTHIKQSIATGNLVYDFCGIGIASIDKFKKSFGGDQVNYQRWVYRPRYLKFFERCYRYLRSKGVL